MPDEIIKAAEIALSVAGDVGKPEYVKAAVDAAVAKYGGLHLAISNAGIDGPLGPLADIGTEAYMNLMDVNLHSVFYGMHYEIPAKRSKISLQFWR